MKTWKSLFLVAVMAALICVPTMAASAKYTIDQGHSDVTFKIRHIVTKMSGKFADFDGAIEFDPQNPTKSTVSFTVQAASIDTGDEDRDKHLRNEDFFDVEKHPTLTFVSKSVKKKSGNVLEVTGDFTMLGVTKEITIPVEFAGPIKGPWHVVAGFETEFEINRKDFGMTWNKALDQGGVVIGEEVEIRIAIEAKQV